MIVALAVAAVGIFAFSFVTKDENSEVDRKIENFSITLMKELYQVNKKVDMLENKVFHNDKEKEFVNALTAEDAINKQIAKMTEDGHSPEEISKVLDIAKEDIEAHLAYSEEKSEVVSG